MVVTSTYRPRRTLDAGKTCMSCCSESSPLENQNKERRLVLLSGTETRLWHLSSLEAEGVQRPGIDPVEFDAFSEVMKTTLRNAESAKRRDLRETMSVSWMSTGYQILIKKNINHSDTVQSPVQWHSEKHDLRMAVCSHRYFPVVFV